MCNLSKWKNFKLTSLSRLNYRFKSRDQNVMNFSRFGSKCYKSFIIHGCNWAFLKNWGVNLTSCTPLMEPLLIHFRFMLFKLKFLAIIGLLMQKANNRQDMQNFSQPTINVKWVIRYQIEIFSISSKLVWAKMIKTHRVSSVL